MLEQDSSTLGTISSKLRNDYLEMLRSSRKPCNIYLVNGIKLQGAIQSFDGEVIILSPNKGDTSQLIERHAVSTVSAAGS